MNFEQSKQRLISENPFYGCKALFALQKQLERAQDDSYYAQDILQTIDAAWKEAKSKGKDYVELFYIIIFSAGDIANRQHNMFVKDVDQGGHSKRSMFRLCMVWLLKNDPEQFYKFMPIIAEYTNFENLFYNAIRTDRVRGTVLKQERLPIDIEKVTAFLAEKINNSATTEFELGLIAKFLPKIPQTNRWRKDPKTGKSVKKSKQAATLNKDKYNVSLIIILCRNLDFTKDDYRKWRSKYLANTEAHLFSTKKISDFDKVQFLTWLEGLPSDARYRVQCRLLNKGDYGVLESTNKWKIASGEDMGTIYLQWLADKETAMKKLVSLTEEDKQNMDKKELRKLEKEAKINTGANTLFDQFVDIFRAGNGKISPGKETELKLQQIVDKVKIDVPVFCLVDSSGSMGGSVRVKDTYVDRIDFAKFLVSIMLYKNPNEDLSSFFMHFGSGAHVITDNTPFDSLIGFNRYISTQTNRTVIKKLCDKQKPFIETYNTVTRTFRAAGATNLNSITESLKVWVNSDPATKSVKIEAICNYPVWLIISDGDFNNEYSGKASMQAFKHAMLANFGADPVVVLWDVNENQSRSVFDDMDNMVHFSGFNPAILNQIFMNINDLDIVDVYISLKSAHLSSRYEPVKNLVK